MIVSRGYCTGESGALHFGLGDATPIDKLVVRWPDLTTQEQRTSPPGQHYTVSKGTKLPKWEAEQTAPLFTQAALPFEAKEKDTQLAEFTKEPLMPIQNTIFGTGVGAADYNGDGNLDLYMAGPAGQAGALLKGDGKGGFTADAAFKGAFPAEAEEMGVLWFDANADGKSDLLVTAGGMEAPAGTDLYGAKLLLNTDTGFTPAPLPARTLSTAGRRPRTWTATATSTSFLTGHLVPHAYLKTVPSALWLNDGKGVFTDATSSWLAAFNQGLPVGEAQFADLTGDGKPDLIAARNFGAVELWAGTGTGFALPAHDRPRPVAQPGDGRLRQRRRPRPHRRQPGQEHQVLAQGRRAVHHLRGRLRQERPARRGRSEVRQD